MTIDALTTDVLTCHVLSSSHLPWNISDMTVMIESMHTNCTRPYLLMSALAVTEISDISALQVFGYHFQGLIYFNILMIFIYTAINEGTNISFLLLSGQTSVETWRPAWAGYTGSARCTCAWWWGGTLFCRLLWRYMSNKSSQVTSSWLFAQPLIQAKKK